MPRARRLCALLAALAIGFAAFTAHADRDAQARLAWQQRAAAVEQAYIDAERELIAARADYKRERRRGRLRGPARKAATDRIQVALVRYALADEARRALP